MASGSFNVTTGNGYIIGKVTWSSVPDTPNNRSTVSAELRLWRTNSYETRTRGTFYIVIDGQTFSNNNGGNQFVFTYNSNTFCVSGSKVVSHNSDGKKSISISVYNASGMQFSMSTQSGTAVLDTIPRASTISSFPNFTIGNSFTVNISRASSSFTHRLSLYVGSTYIGEWSNVGTSQVCTLDSTHLSRMYGAISTSGTVTMYCTTFNGSTQIGQTSKTATATVANASTISSFPSFTIENSLAISISRALSAFTHTIEGYIGNTKIFTRTGIGTSTTISFTGAENNAMYSALKNATSGIMTLYCYTYHNSNYIRSYTSKASTVYVGGGIAPTFTSITAAETVSAVSALGVYVQNLSRIKFTINGAAGAKYSTISSYRISFNGVVYNSSVATTGAINASGPLTATATITDSRGRTATKTISVTLVAYAPPKISSLSVGRCNADGTSNPLGTYVKVAANGSVSSISSKNTMQYRVKTSSRGANTWVTKKDSTVPIPTLEDVTVISVYEVTKSYDLRVELVDKFNTTLSVATINTGAVTMSWSPEGIAVGKVWEPGLGTLQLANAYSVPGSVPLLDFTGDYTIYRDDLSDVGDGTRWWLHTPDKGEVIIGPRIGVNYLDRIRLKSRTTKVEGVLNVDGMLAADGPIYSAGSRVPSWRRVDNLSSAVEITSTSWTSPTVIPLTEPYTTKVYAVEFRADSDNRSSQFVFFRGTTGASAGGIVAIGWGTTVFTVSKIRVSNNANAIGFYNATKATGSSDIALSVVSVYVVSEV